eukprot:171292_1
MEGIGLRLCAQIVFILGGCLVVLQFELIAQYATLEPLYIKHNEPEISCEYYTNFGPEVHRFYPPKVIRRIENDTIHSKLPLVKSVTETHLFSTLFHNQFATFCSKRYKPEGTGNALAIYWTARAIAFFANYTFILDTAQCTQKPFKMFDQNASHSTWTWFLDKESNTTLHNLCSDPCPQYDTIISNYDFLWKYYANADKRPMFDIPYRSYIVFLMYNPWFAQIIQRDTRNAFLRYFTQNELTPFHDSVMRDMSNTNQHLIVVIHIRCGDLLFHHRRVLLNMRYFAKALDMVMAHIGDLDSNKLYKFQVISQLSEGNSHTYKDLNALPISQKVVYHMIERIEKYIARKYRIQYELEIIGNGTADNDYFQMITAPYLICSPSSFCFNAAIANYYDPQLMILPQIGAWKRQKKSYKYVADNTKYGVLSHHKWLDTKGMFIKVSELFGKLTDLPSETDLVSFKRWFVGKRYTNKTQENP